MLKRASSTRHSIGSHNNTSMRHTTDINNKIYTMYILQLGFYIKGKRQEKSLTFCLRESVQATNNGYITANWPSGSKWVLFNTDHCVNDLYFRAI